MLATLVALAILAALALVAYAWARPDEFRIERATTIAAPPEKIFGFIEDFHRWTDWSPYETLDANLKRTYGGAERGVGATYAWEGRKAGAGSMAIARADSPTQVLIDLVFTKPFPARNLAEFSLAPEGDATRVTWAMSGHNSYMAKLMGVFFDMEKMVGPQFDEGLAKLKAAAERQG